MLFILILVFLSCNPAPQGKTLNAEQR